MAFNYKLCISDTFGLGHQLAESGIIHSIGLFETTRFEMASFSDAAVAILTSNSTSSTPVYEFITAPTRHLRSFRTYVSAHPAL